MNRISKSTASESSNPTMDELLKKYNQVTRSLKVGDVVVGKIIDITPKAVFLDIGGKSEGIVAEKAFKEAESLIKNLKIEDEVKAKVLVTESRNGYVVLSLRATLYEQLWKKVLESLEKGDALDVVVKSVSNAGLMVDFSGLTGFIPKSQIGKEALASIDSLIGKNIKAVVIDAQKENNKIVLSEKEVSEAKELAIVREAVEKVKIGEIFEGEVSAIYDFGCFVKVKVDKKDKIPLEGLVHISELSWEKIGKPEDVASIGDKVKVKVIGKNCGKLSFSIKQIKGDPWENVEKRYKKEAKFKGTVSKVSNFGVFVTLEPGVEGLVHITKIPPDKRLLKGEDVDVYVEEVNRAKKKISLGLILKEKPMGYK